MKKQKAIFIIGAIVLGLIGLVVLGFFLFVISGAFAILMPEPPEPQIQYGEFPFTITYEINNEIKTYEDAVICEYEGIENLGTAGKYRKWSRKLKSGNEHIVILQSKTGDSFFKIYVPIPGLPEYYMGDYRKSKEEYERIMNNVSSFGYIQNGSEHSITKEEAWEKYGIRIINKKCSEPIENQFVEE